MMKQYKITSENIVGKSEDDCYISPDDPVWDLMGTSMLGGLGSAETLARYNANKLPQINSCNKGQIQREQNIKPGTPEWVDLWFGRNL